MTGLFEQFTAIVTFLTSQSPQQLQTCSPASHTTITRLHVNLLLCEQRIIASASLIHADANWSVLRLANKKNAFWILLIDSNENKLHSSVLPGFCDRTQTVPTDFGIAIVCLPKYVNVKVMQRVWKKDIVRNIITIHWYKRMLQISGQFLRKGQHIRFYWDMLNIHSLPYINYHTDY